jgi:hypothetical protein
MLKRWTIKLKLMVITVSPTEGENSVQFTTSISYLVGIKTRYTFFALKATNLNWLAQGGQPN